MVVTAQRIGGIAGWRERLGPIDTDDAVTGAQIVQAVTDADFFSLPEEYPPKRRIYDGHQFSLTARDEDASHTVAWETGSEVPETLHAIISAMNGSAEWERIEFDRP
jgi:hypothetical protein